jgi:hypothetical protein
MPQTAGVPISENSFWILGTGNRVLLVHVEHAVQQEEKSHAEKYY